MLKLKASTEIDPLALVIIIGRTKMMIVDVCCRYRLSTILLMDLLTRRNCTETVDCLTHFCDGVWMLNTSIVSDQLINKTLSDIFSEDIKQRILVNRQLYSTTRVNFYYF